MRTRRALLTLMLVLACAAPSTGADAPSAVLQAKAYIAEQMVASGVPGYSYAIIQGGQLLAIGASGVADTSGRAASPDTPFILGSTTKSFTALAVMQLVDAGKINLDRPASDYVQGFLNDTSAARQLTVRMLLNQTSGLSHNAGDQPVWSAGEAGRDAIRHWVLSLRADALNRPVGQHYEYSNANYIVLGAVVESVSGEPYGAYLGAHILTPLGMTHSYTSLGDGVLHGLASGHRQWFGQFQASALPYPEAFVPAGFLITTASDMARYLEMIAGNGQIDGVRVLSDASMTQLLRGAAPFDETGKSSYAMGWVSDTFNGIPVVYHDGDTGRFSSVMAVSRGSHFGVVLLANGSGWLHGSHMIDAANGAINLLDHKTPKSYAIPHLLTKAMLAVMTGIPALQLVFLLWSLPAAGGAPRSLFAGRLVPAVTNGMLAAALAYGVPHFIIGVPLIEHVLSIPDLGAAALLSVAVAAAWLVRVAAGLRGG